MRSKQTPWVDPDLSYWKKHISIYHMLASELAYSLIYDNIRPEKLDEALATVGLETLPNRFFLIQVDDYHNRSSKLQITQEFFQKTSLVNLIREQMEKSELEGFCANLVGMDKIICFFCFPEQAPEETRQFLLSIAEDFKACIRKKSPYTVSVCISEDCQKLPHFSRMFPRMNLALTKSYFSGKEFSIFLEHVMEYANSENIRDSILDYYPELLASIVRHNRTQFEQVQQGILQFLIDAQLQPQTVRLELIRLLQRVEEYCIRCGVPEMRIHSDTENAAARILASGFLADTQACFRAYYEQVANALEEYSTDDSYTFRLPVTEYLAEHYPEPLKVKTVADMMGFSEGHFTRMFRKEFGMTFVQYLTQLRIEKSKQLLAQTQIPIEQIADQVGIGNYSYFCTCFKQICGCSPGTYRMQTAAEKIRSNLSES